MKLKRSEGTVKEIISKTSRDNCQKMMHFTPQQLQAHHNIPVGFYSGVLTSFDQMSDIQQEKSEELMGKRLNIDMRPSAEVAVLLGKKNQALQTYRYENYLSMKINTRDEH